MIATENKIKVVIDTNIFISTLVFGGNALEILRLLLKGEIEVYLSPFIIADIARILREKFLWEEAKIEKALELIRSKANEVHLITRGSNHQNLFSCADGYERFLNTLTRYCPKSKGEIY